MKLSEARSYDYLKFIRADKATQKEVTQTLNRVARKRVKRLEDIGADSFAVSKLETAGGIQTTRYKSTLDMWRNVSRVNSFLDAKTSTVTGYKQVISDVANRIQSPEYKNLSNNERNEFWSLYNQLENMGFIEELRSRDLSSDYVQTLVFELHESGYGYEDAQEVIGLMREEFNSYDLLHKYEMENF